MIMFIGCEWISFLIHMHEKKNLFVFGGWIMRVMREIVGLLIEIFMKKINLDFLVILKIK